MRKTQQAFTQLLREMHLHSGRSATVVSGLSGITPSYLSELLKGKKRQVSFFVLRMLCEQGWRLSDAESLKVFAARIAIDVHLDLPMPAEFFWRMGQYRDLCSFAQAAGITKSYLTHIMKGRRVPTQTVMQNICRTLAYDEATAAQFQLLCWKAANRKLQSKWRRLGSVNKPR